jgi:hypothetical protein
VVTNEFVNSLSLSWVADLPVPIAHTGS